MGDIVTLPTREAENIVWRCNCGCISFELRPDGDAVCVQCEHPVSGMDGAWRQKLPDQPAKPEPVGAGDVTVTDLNSSGAALRRAIDRAEPGTTAMLIVIQQDGAVTTWGETIDGEAQSEWFDRRIATAKQMLTKG